MTDEFDFNAAYRVEGWPAVAWRATSYGKIYDEDYEWSGIIYDDTERVVCHMVGDDKDYTFGVEELTKIDEEDYCPECGQIGCKTYG